MSKISLHIRLINKEDKTDLKWETLGIKRDNIIIYNEDTVKVKIDLDKSTLIRENDDYSVEFDFKNNKSFYTLKKYLNRLELDLKTKKVEINNKNIKINYIINMEKEVEYMYEINYEVI